MSVSFSMRLGNYVQMAGSYALRGGLGHHEEARSRWFTGPNFALKEESEDAYTLMVNQMWHTMIGKDEVKRLLLGAREWFDEHVPPDKR